MLFFYFPYGKTPQKPFEITTSNILSWLNSWTTNSQTSKDQGKGAVVILIAYWRQFQGNCSKKGADTGTKSLIPRQPIFPPPYSEFCIAWCHGSQICLFEVFKYIRGLQNWNKKSKISDSKCDNSPALLQATWPCFDSSIYIYSIIQYHPNSIPNHSI